MDRFLKSLQGKKGQELETIGSDIFKKIGLKCITIIDKHKRQIPIKQIKPDYTGTSDDNIEIDYFIPEGKVCLIGEITGRNDESNIRKKYQKFLNAINIIKSIKWSDELCKQIGITQADARNFRDIETMKGFFITTTKEKSNINLSIVDDIAIFYQSDFVRLHEYAESIGEWTKNYFLNSFGIDHNRNNALTIYEKNNSLIRSTDRKISKKDIPLANLYTFSVFPYELLDIAHVYRRDELPLLQNSTYNYQRPLDHKKIEEIRNNLLTDQDFMFPSNILVILSKECKYTKDGTNNSYLYIPRQYGSISIIDGQHRLFSYANGKVKKTMTSDCKIMVTAVEFKTEAQSLIHEFTAKVFIEININQTKVEISHLDKIAYELGSDDPKVIATKIIVSLNQRNKFSKFFDIKSDKLSQGIIEAKTIINEIKIITNIKKIKQLENARTYKNKHKKSSYEKLFATEITKLSNREVLVEKVIILFERYFNEIFSIFKHDKPKNKNEPKSSFLYSNFWGGWIKLLVIFTEEGLDWSSIKKELENIKQNVMILRNINDYNSPLFKADDPTIPSSDRATKTSKFLNQNRQQPVSIQDIS